MRYLSTNDSIALGVIKALRESNYAKFPILTGQDCDIANIKAIENGEQSMSLFIDTRALAYKAIELVDDILINKTTTIANSNRYNNGVKTVPTSICIPIYVDINNYKEVLVTQGRYYTEEDLK